MQQVKNIHTTLHHYGLVSSMMLSKLSMHALQTCVTYDAVLTLAGTRSIVAETNLEPYESLDIKAWFWPKHR